MITILCLNHYGLELCTYGKKGQKHVTDVFWKEGCHVPEVTVSEVVTLMQKGILSKDHEVNQKNIFEASLYIYGVSKEHNIAGLKQLLPSFKGEFYAEKGEQLGSYYLHFYKL